MRYREVIRMPLWLLALIYFFFLSFVLSVWAALGNSAALITFLVLSVLLVLIAFGTRLIIHVNESELMVGRAHIELRYVGEVTELDSAAMKAIRSRDANPIAFLAIRLILALMPSWVLISGNGSVALVRKSTVSSSDSMVFDWA